LHPELAAKFKHYFGVDDENMIKLFEPRPVPGFGGNHVAATDGWGMGYNLNVHDEEFESESHRHNKNDGGPDPDLICTLGGDGLLMYACKSFILFYCILRFNY
jgi:NAD kinase